MGLANPTHVVIIAVVALLVFGAKRLPEIGRSLGAGMRDFKDSLNGDESPQPELHAATRDEPAAH